MSSRSGSMLHGVAAARAASASRAVSCARGKVEVTHAPTGIPAICPASFVPSSTPSADNPRSRAGSPLTIPSTLNNDCPCRANNSNRMARPYLALWGVSCLWGRTRLERTAARFADALREPPRYGRVIASRIRIQVPDVVYHVASRGVDKQPIFGVVDGDRFVFLALLAKTVERYGWRLHAYCLMGNHFHLVVETPEANIAAGMQYLKSSYALWFNDFRPREGTLFERRYYSDVILEEGHLFALCRYVVLNPVRAGLCRPPADWPWSSYRATAGIAAPPAWLHTDLIYAIFGGGSAAQRRYVEFVIAALDESRAS